MNRSPETAGYHQEYQHTHNGSYKLVEREKEEKAFEVIMMTIFQNLMKKKKRILDRINSKRSGVEISR